MIVVDIISIANFHAHLQVISRPQSSQSMLAASH